MITQTSLRSPRFLGRVKGATAQAIRAAHRSVRPSAVVSIENRRGQAHMCIEARRRKPARYWHLDVRDITVVVLDALRRWHESFRQLRATKRAAGAPVRLEDFPCSYV